VLEPDVSFVSAATLSRGPKPDPDAFLRLVPDLVVEILSPSTASRDRLEKKKIYEKNGVGEYWIVDPRSRRVTIFCLEGEAYGEAKQIMRGAAESSVLPGFSILLDSVFAELD